jgi:hypothetical protein
LLGTLKEVTKHGIVSKHLVLKFSLYYHKILTEEMDCLLSHNDVPNVLAGNASNNE